MVVCYWAKCWAPLDLCDVGEELSNVCRRLSVQWLVYQQATFELHPLRNTQPVKFVPQKWHHVVVHPPAVDNSDCVVQNRLNALHLTGWEACKKTVAIVYSGNNEAVDQLDGRRCRNWTSNCSKLSKFIERRAHQHIDVGWYIHRFVEVCAQVSNGWCWSNIAVWQMQCAVLNKM